MLPSVVFLLNSVFLDASWLTLAHELETRPRGHGTGGDVNLDVLTAIDSVTGLEIRFVLRKDAKRKVQLMSLFRCPPIARIP